MIKHSAEFLRCLIELDGEGMRRLHAHVSPHMAQPKTSREILATMHHARTQTARVPERLRFYSHAWLLDNGLPSALPDHLKPAADRLYPRIVDGVGISVNTTSSFFKPYVKIVERAMLDAVEEAYADNKKAPEFIRVRMAEARDRAIKTL